MSKLSATILLSTGLLAATSAEIEQYLHKTISQNPMIKRLSVKVVEEQKLDFVPGWTAYTVALDANVKKGDESRDLKQRLIYFSQGDVITTDLTDIKTGRSLRDSVSPKFKQSYYRPANLISGDAKSTHKVAIFSDPLCPFCRRYVPKALEDMMKSPKTFAVYYYHFPLEQLHPAAVALTRAAVAAEMMGKKDAVMKMYEVKVDARETDEAKIVKAFNETMGTNLSVKDIHTSAVDAHMDADQEVISALMVSGTPTVYFDGEKDATKTRYLQVKAQ